MRFSLLACNKFPKRIAKCDSLIRFTYQCSSTPYLAFARQTPAVNFSTQSHVHLQQRNPFEFLTSLLGPAGQGKAHVQEQQTTKNQEEAISSTSIQSTTRIERNKGVAQSISDLLQEKNVLERRPSVPKVPSPAGATPVRRSRKSWYKSIYKTRGRYAKYAVGNTELSRVFLSPRLRGFSQSRRPYIIFEPLRQSPKTRVISALQGLPELVYNTMRSYARILTTPTADTPGTTLLLHFDTKRYLIGNIAEGTQRVNIQRQVRLMNVSEIFITGQTEWTKIGGLMGMILSLADVRASAAQSAWEAQYNKAQKKALMDEDGDGKGGNKFENQDTVRVRYQVDKGKLTLFGPPNLTHSIATARNFVFRKGMPLNITEVKNEKRGEEEDGTWPPTWYDENIRVWAMSVAPFTNAEDATATVDASVRTHSRKRSYAEFDIGEATDKEANETVEERNDRYDQIRKAVVSDMFDSSWHLDALVEMALSEVKLPASLWIRNTESKQLERYDGPMPGSPDFKDVRVLLRKPWPGALVNNLPPTQPAKEAISYIIRTHRQRGRFKRAVAEQLEVDVLKWGQLAKGATVQNKHGLDITPDMVLEEGRQGGGLAVVDLPSTDYVQSLVDRPEWRSASVMDGVGAIVWILGPGVAFDDKLSKFISEFKHLKHVISSKDCCPNILALDSVAATTARLSQIDPERFRIPAHEDTNASVRVQPTPTIFQLQSEVVAAHRGQHIQLTPSLSLDNNNVEPLLDVNAVLSEISPEILELAQSARQAVAEDMASLSAWAETLPSKDAEIITLGTGSAVPSKYRNVSATLLRVPGYGSYLFDCGENTLGQLKRVFNPEELKAVLQELKMIWISHMHADHHLGTVSVIKAWHEETYGSALSSSPYAAIDKDMNPQRLLRKERRLALISEPSMLHYLREYASVEDFGYTRLAPLQISPAEPLNSIRSHLEWFGSPSPFARLDPSRYSNTSLGFSDIQAVNVDHCYGARAVSITFPNGFKVSYSGDCRPSRNFARIGKNTTVLIHEATFDDELVGDAEAKKHSTTSEALGIGIAMEAKAVVLTHFSQRYAKIPNIEALDEQVLDSEERADEEWANGSMANAHVEPTVDEQVVGKEEKADVERADATIANGFVGPIVDKAVVENEERADDERADVTMANGLVEPTVDEHVLGKADEGRANEIMAKGLDEPTMDEQVLQNEKRADKERGDATMTDEHVEPTVDEQVLEDEEKADEARENRTMANGHIEPADLETSARSDIGVDDGASADPAQGETTDIMANGHVEPNDLDIPPRSDIEFDVGPSADPAQGGTNETMANGYVEPADVDTSPRSAIALDVGAGTDSAQGHVEPPAFDILPPSDIVVDVGPGTDPAQGHVEPTGLDIPPRSAMALDDGATADATIGNFEPTDHDISRSDIGMDVGAGTGPTQGNVESLDIRPRSDIAVDDGASAGPAQGHAESLDASLRSEMALDDGPSPDPAQYRVESHDTPSRSEMVLDDGASADAAQEEIIKVPKSRANMKVCVAFDYMRVRVGDIAQLEKFTPVLLKLFARREDEQDDPRKPRWAGGENEKMNKGQRRS